MIRLLVSLLLLAGLGFYVGWPAYSGYQIKAALDAEDKAALSRKIDFERVRVSLKPAVTAEVESRLAEAVKRSGRPPATMDKIRAEGMPKLIDTALAALVSPDGLVRLYRERADVKAEVARIVAEKLASPAGLMILGEIAGAVGSDSTAVGNVIGQLGRLADQSGVDPGKVLGGLFGKPDGGKANGNAGGSATAGGGAAGSGGAGGRLGIANVKSLAPTGPLGFTIGIAKDAAATAPDVTAEIEFTGGDWKVVGLTPRS